MRFLVAFVLLFGASTVYAQSIDWALSKGKSISWDVAQLPERIPAPKETEVLAVPPQPVAIDDDLFPVKPKNKSSVKKAACTCGCGLEGCNCGGTGDCKPKQPCQVPNCQCGCVQGGPCSCVGDKTTGLKVPKEFTAMVDRYSQKAADGTYLYLKSDDGGPDWTWDERRQVYFRWVESKRPPMSLVESRTVDMLVTKWQYDRKTAEDVVNRHRDLISEGYGRYDPDFISDLIVSSEGVPIHYSNWPPDRARFGVGISLGRFGIGVGSCAGGR